MPKSSPNMGTEIMANIMGIEKFLPIVRKLAKNCVECDKFDYCITRALEATGITVEDMMLSYYKLLTRCEEYHEKGMELNTNIRESI